MGTKFWIKVEVVDRLHDFGYYCLLLATEKLSNVFCKRRFQYLDRHLGNINFCGFKIGLLKQQKQNVQEYESKLNDCITAFHEEHTYKDMPFSAAKYILNVLYFAT